MRFYETVTGMLDGEIAFKVPMKGYKDVDGRKLYIMLKGMTNSIEYYSESYEEENVRCDALWAIIASIDDLNIIYARDAAQYLVKKQYRRQAGACDGRDASVLRRLNPFIFYNQVIDSMKDIDIEGLGEFEKY